ncbi:PKD domain-containing protein [Robiginitalea aurantiaca]|uniref:PKD domain-containing protein n=1 Tax=Robiginitalea aurantiaca TaxID=3056915 RepID=A0ABT7WD91_9FLAO|nr:PKD domain-containing protein [Robiginitalea aurantiaca]MDM9630887.1 PKD domain-containing protein [Robiginitalea aurantiaca]
MKTTKLLTAVLTLIGTIVLTSSCDFDYDLPEEGSIPDETPPSANFSAAQSDTDFLLYNFANLSSSATTYEWDFGDGNTSAEIDPSNTYPDEGTYTVNLTASDALGATSTFTMDVTVVEPEVPEAIVPVVLEGDFEDNSLPDGSGDGRDSWRNDFGGVIQITSSPVQSGDQASKYPSDGDRVAYQEGIAVTPNTDYIITYYYTLKTNNPGSVTLTVLGGGITDLSEVESKKLVDLVGMDQADADTYTKVDLSFNTGANATVAILITNEGEEARVDNISMAPVPE